MFYLVLLDLEAFYFLSNCSGQNLNSVLNKSDDSGYPCVTPDHEGQVCSFFTTMTLAVDVSYIAFILRHIPSILILQVFFINRH